MAAGQATELIIRNGTIITDTGTAQGDLRVRNGLIEEIGGAGERLVASPGAREIDANGLLVLPGGVDPHVHLGGNWVDDYTSGSAAALAGGITTISNFVNVRGDQVSEAIADVISLSWRSTLLLRLAPLRRSLVTSGTYCGPVRGALVTTTRVSGFRS